MFIRNWNTLYRAADGSGAAAAPAPAATPAATAAPAGTPSATPAPAPAATPAPGPSGDNPYYKPEGIPEHMLGKSDKETIDNLVKAVAGFRKDLSKKGVPDKADAYELKLDDELKGKILRPGADGKDPLLEKFKTICHKSDIPNAVFQDLVVEFSKAALENGGGAGGEEAALDFDYKNLGGMEKAKPQIDGAEVWLQGLVQSKKISENTAKELKLMTAYGEGLNALLELRGLSGEAPIPKALEGGRDGEITKAMLDSRVADEKYWLHKDPAFIEETTKMFEKFYAKAG